MAAPAPLGADLAETPAVKSVASNGPSWEELKVGDRIHPCGYNGDRCILYIYTIYIYMYRYYIYIYIYLYINIYIFHNVCIVFASIFLGIEAEEGSVHCYDGLPEASGPVWSGSSFSAD